MEVEVLTSKLEKATLTRNMAESRLSDFEREKTIIELEIKEIIARHKTEVTEKMSRAAQVCALIIRHFNIPVQNYFLF